MTTLNVFISNKAIIAEISTNLSFESTQNKSMFRTVKFYTSKINTNILKIQQYKMGKKNKKINKYLFWRHSSHRRYNLWLKVNMHGLNI